MKNKIFLVVIILLGIVSNIFPQQTFRKAIFLHRSVGGNVFGPNGSNTSVPAQCGSYNITHNYTGADAVSMDGVNFPWNGNSGNAWWEWHRVFDDLDPDDDIYQYIDGTDYDIIIIKTCYTVSGMTEGIGVPADTIHYDWKSQAVFRWHVRSILEIMEAHPDKFFVMWNLVPVLNDGTFSPSVVANDALFSTWMKDTLAAGLDAVYGAFPPNVYVFDIFNKIDSSNYMPTSLSVSATDNHLNATATELLAPQFVQEIFDAAFAYEMGGPETFQLSVPIQNGWNMVSVPGIHPTNQNVNTWWSGKDPAAGVFRFSGGYLPVTTTTPGQGYWMKNLGANTYNTGDEWPAGGIQIVPNVPITGATGWNLIGGFELSVLTANITTTPGGLRTGQVFGYSSGYTPATNLVPGYAYWIKLTGAGSINIPTALAKGLAKTTEVNTSDRGKIIITDNSGTSYTLYTVKGEVNLNDYVLPPSPPAGMFDVRFGSGRYAEKLSTSDQTIELNSLEYPVKVRVDNADIRLQDQAGNGLNERMKSGEEVTISNSSINKLMVSGDIVPKVYSLEQNFPNPFNPSTKIRYTIPSNVKHQTSNVVLKVYDILGNELVTLVNDYRPAGAYEIEFNTSSISHQPSSGIYFYRLQSGDYAETKKMILLK